MDKAHILREIKRTADANGGVPLGTARFEAETGIKLADWYGIHWARWSDALREGGYAPNQFNTAFEEERLLDQYARYAQQLGRLPTSGELRLKRRQDRNFPSANTFGRFGSKGELCAKLLDYCQSREGFEEVCRGAEEYLRSTQSSDGVEPLDPPDTEVLMGYVYLAKMDRWYKIGRTNSVGRREYEVNLQLPERMELVHVIPTDDPVGIEEYWHKRFAAKNTNGEWFALDPSDVAAFKRRKFM